MYTKAMNTKTYRTTGLNIADVTFTNHFIKQARHKGFTADQIAGALSQTGEDARITDVRRYAGQRRYCGDGVAVVMSGNVAITIYADSVVTPLREDQMDDPEALNSRRIGRLSH